MGTSKILQIRAGIKAYKRIQQIGLRKEDICAVAAAAGGPKWFTVYGLTRYIIGDFLHDNTDVIDFIGASVGSWQMACALTQDPTAAIDRLRNAYAQQIYDGRLDPLEITASCKHFIQEAIKDQQKTILDHESRRLHIITSRGKGLLSSKNKPVQALGFASSFLGNMVSRKGMNWSAERNIFSTSLSLPYDVDKDILTTVQHQLTDDNMIRVMQASGTIPFMMMPQYNLPGARPGAYWDGGLTDYHVSLPYNRDGIVLLPHFYPFVYARWFDKKLPWKRFASQEDMSNVLVISPSDEYVRTLPQGRISEMADAKRFDENQDGRVAYWMEISDRSLELGQALRDAIQDGSVVDIVEPY